MKNLKTIVCCFLFLGIFHNSFAQAEKNHWYFGSNAYIDFTSGSPVVGNGNLNTSEGCATVSTSNGALLFYTDGIFVYDINGNQMPNGSGLKGDPSSTHSALVVPNPCDINIYYIFTTTSIGQDGMYYYEVDLTLNGGLGDIVVGSETLLLIDATEKIAAVKNTNGEDFWVTTTRLSTGFTEIYTWGVTLNGVSLTPNIFTSTHSTTLGDPFYGDIGNYPGQLKFNTDGTLLAAAQLYVDKEIDLYTFDATTGTATSFVTNITTSGFPYGVEFSPNGNYLYTTSYFSKNAYQFDITNPTSIPAPNILGSIAGARGGALQLSPNTLSIYVANSNTNTMGEITAINTAGATYSGGAITLQAGTQCRLGLPTFISGIQGFSSNCLSLDPFQNAIPNLASQTVADEIEGIGFSGLDKEYGDFDNDGDIDILYTKINPSSNSPELHVLINNAGIGNPPSYSVPGVNLNVDFCYSHRLFDWNNNGWNDVIVYGHNGGVYVFLNDQAGGLNLAPITLLQGTVHFTYIDQVLIEVGDLNNDGLPDLLLSGQSQEIPGTVYFENTGGNTFILPAPQVWTPGVGITNPFIPENGGSYPTPEIYDADCDGDLDLFISDPLIGPPIGGGRVLLYENNGGLTSNTLPDVAITGVNNQFGFNDDIDPNSLLRCDWVIMRIVDYDTSGCPIAISYNPCNGEFLYYDQDCSCTALLTTNDFDANSDKSTIILHPNPANNVFSIHSKITQKIDGVTLYNIQGQVVASFSKNEEQRYNISQLNSGLYVVKIISEGKITLKKLIKK